jgi:glycerophosphoryl diester phosphodiesterase
VPADVHHQLPIGFAHRGGRHAGTRENTLEAFSRALADGASGLEADAWVTADGVAVLDHDGTVGWRRRPIRTVDRLALPSHIPALSDLYDQLGAGFELSLDVKDERAAATVIRVAAGAAATERLWLCHADAAMLATWSAFDARVKLVQSTSLRALGNAPFADGDALDAINLRAREWTAELVERAHAAGLLAFGWDAHDRSVLTRLVGMGIDAVYSNDVPAMVDVLARTNR